MLRSCGVFSGKWISSLKIIPNHAPCAVFQTAAAHKEDPCLEVHYPEAHEQAPRLPFQELQFNDAQQAFQAKSTGKLIQSLAVFRACSLKPLVENADTIIRASRRVAAPLVDSIVKATMFRHFCGGECVESIQPTLKYLEENGIRPILNYAAEDDVSAEPEEATSCPHAAAERCLDRNTAIFMRSIRDSDNFGNRAFVAIKVTALAPPKLLEKMSELLTQHGDLSDRGFCSARLAEAMLPHLDEQEQASFHGVLRRLDTLADALIAKGNSRVLVDAEHTYFQPAIDALTIRLQQRCNRQEPVVLNTYQCYLKDAAARIETDMQRAAAEGWKFGAKTVRGAYMVVERARAAEKGYESPIWDSLQETHDNYNRCAARVLEAVAEGSAELMVASHNQETVALATRRMHELGLQPSSSGVYFGQLLGMADHLSFTLGRAGYRIHKIVPYGPVHETLQYLIRRAQENSSIMSATGKEREMIQAELIRRLRESLSLNRLFKAPGAMQQPSASAAA
ncbi:g6925 [Coccomyxa viridis]|uniref:Proline dehydrogenase n=1 Tax=Coccomyxa viridis TaxID=1274662 RepID=A0ABP1FWK9_9CHLO